MEIYAVCLNVIKNKMTTTHKFFFNGCFISVYFVVRIFKQSNDENLFVEP